MVYCYKESNYSLSESAILDISISTIVKLHSRSLSYICLNARSIVNKRLDLMAMLSRLSPDIVIAETFLDESILNGELFPVDYTVFRRDQTRHGGGVLIAISNSFSAICCTASVS